MQPSLCSRRSRVAVWWRNLQWTSAQPLLIVAGTALYDAFHWGLICPPGLITSTWPGLVSEERDNSKPNTFWRSASPLVSRSTSWQPSGSRTPRYLWNLPHLATNLPLISALYPLSSTIWGLSSARPRHRPFPTPPCGCLYHITGPKREAMTTCIQKSLAAGIIRLSSSPARAGFLFLEKKDKSFCPCINHQGLNAITVKNRYPLTLTSSAFNLLQGANIFSMLDLCNAYHFVWIREGNEWNTAFNTPTGH